MNLFNRRLSLFITKKSTSTIMLDDISLIDVFCSVDTMICGTYDVGKTSICYRYFREEIKHLHVENTIGVQMYHKIIPSDEGNIKLKMWDFSGFERFHHAMQSFYYKAFIVVLTYDVTRYTTLQHAIKLYEEIIKMNPCTQFILVGNKSDLSISNNTFEQAVLFKQVKNIPHIIVSSKENRNINLLFEEIIKIVKSYTKLNSPRNTPMITFNDKYLEIKNKKEIIENSKEKSCFQLWKQLLWKFNDSDHKN